MGAHVPSGRWTLAMFVWRVGFPLPPLIKIGEYFVDEKETFSIDVCEFKGISYCNGCGNECNGGKSFRFVKIKDNSVYRTVERSVVVEIKQIGSSSYSDMFLLEETIRLIQKYQIKRIVETGTQYGNSTYILSQLVEKVDSIELKIDNYNRAKTTLREVTNITLHCGNSVDVLKQIISDGETNLLLFLDAHGIAASECPIRSELDSLVEKNIKPVLIIHDFLVPGWHSNVYYKELKVENLQDKLDKLYGINKWSCHYNTLETSIGVGIIYITPNAV